MIVGADRISLTGESAGRIERDSIASQGGITDGIASVEDEGIVCLSLNSPCSLHFSDYR